MAVLLVITFYVPTVERLGSTVKAKFIYRLGKLIITWGLRQCRKPSFAFAESSMNGTLRLAFSCLTFTVWSVPAPFENNVVWHGPTAWFMKDIQSKLGLDYIVVTELPEHEHPALAALAKGIADMSIDTWGINYQRFKFVDFSYTQEYFGVYIISGRNTDYSARNLVIGVFDDLSYGIGLSVLLAMVFTIWLISLRERTDHSITTTLFYMVGNTFKQPLVAALWPKRNIGIVIVNFFTL